MPLCQMAHIVLTLILRSIVLDWKIFDHLDRDRYHFIWADGHHWHCSIAPTCVCTNINLWHSACSHYFFSSLASLLFSSFPSFFEFSFLASFFFFSSSSSPSPGSGSCKGDEQLEQNRSVIKLTSGENAVMWERKSRGCDLVVDPGPPP